MAQRGYLYGLASLYIGKFRIEYVACAGDVHDVVEVLCIHALGCGCVVDV